MNLTPLTEYIDYLDRVAKKSEPKDRIVIESMLWVKLMQRVTAIKLPLELGQFIPCNKDGKPLEKPKHYETWIKLNCPKQGTQGFIMSDESVNDCEEYHKSVERVLLKGWEHEPIATLKTIIIKDGRNAIRFEQDEIWLGFNFTHKLTTIESISHLNLELTQQGEKQLS